MLESYYCGAVAGTASADVESANIVGYQRVEIPTGYSLYTATFKNMSSETLDLRTLRVAKKDGTEFSTSATAKTGVCKGAVRIQKITAGGAYSTIYYWYSTVNGGCWAIDSTTPVTDPIELLPGEGFAIFNEYVEKKGNPSEPVSILMSGEVDLVCKNTVATGYSIMGNATPVDIDLKDISVCKKDGTAFSTSATAKTGVCKGAVRVQKITAGGAYDTIYYWYSTVNGGCWTIDSTTPAADAIPLKAGESFAIFNEYVEKKGNPAEPVMLVLPSPIPAAK